MSKIRTLRKRRAVSPVIATVIIVAVTITVAVAVSYWMSGIASQYTSFEKVELKSAYASRKYDATTPFSFLGWVIEIGVQNTGSSTSTLDSIFVNEKPILEYGNYTLAAEWNKIRWTDTPATVDTWQGWEAITPITSISLESGDEDKLYILIYGEDVTAGLFSAGTTINLKLQSANGMDYIKLVKLN